MAYVGTKRVFLVFGKERGVENMMDLRQMLPLKMKDVPNVAHVFFVVKPKLELMSLIADNIHSL